MGAGERVAAVLTGAAGARVGADAEEALAKPEREPLLTHPEWAMQEKRTGECIATDRVVEALTQSEVSVDGQKRHTRR